MRYPRDEWLRGGMLVHFRTSGTLFCSFHGKGTNEECSAPHPSENHIQIRIQMYGPSTLALFLFLGGALTSLPDNLSSLTALLSALDDLDALFGSIEDAYKASLGRDDIEVWDEKR
jgi:hypothetical protein